MTKPNEKTNVKIMPCLDMHNGRVLKGIQFVNIRDAGDPVDFTRFGVLVQDYGGPMGFRILSRNPGWLEWLIIQNTNAYEVGFTAAWEGFRNALWKNRTPETEKPLTGFLELDAIKSVYLHGHKKAGGWRGVPEGLAQRRDASARFGSLRGGGLPGLRRYKHPSLP